MSRLEKRTSHWKQFLRAVHQEEAKYIVPLQMGSLLVQDHNGDTTTTTSATMMMRSGVLSRLIPDYSPNNNRNRAAKKDRRYADLDRIALRAVHEIESTPELFSLFQTIENDALLMIQELTLILETEQDGDHIDNDGDNVTFSSRETLEKHFTNVAMRCPGLEPSKQYKSFISRLKPDEACKYLKISPADDIPIIIDDDDNENENENSDDEDDDAIKERTTMAAPEIRHAACSLVIRSMDHVRRLSLGRCLLLKRFGCPVGTMHQAIRAYLHSLAVLWTFAQEVPLPSTHREAMLSSSSSSSPPKKRLSIGKGRGIFPDKCSKTSVLDAHLIQIYQGIGYQMKHLSPSETIIRLASCVVSSALKTSANGSSPYDRLPEIAALPRPRKNTIATDYPRLALRLLSVTQAYRPFGDTLNAKIARNEGTAECLLIESNQKENKSQILRQKASEYLSNSFEEEFVDRELIEQAYLLLLETGDTLNQYNTDDRSELDEAERHLMMQEVQRLLYGSTSSKKTSDTAIRVDVHRLCNRHTFQRLFAPFFLQRRQPNLFRSMDDTTSASVKALVNGLLRVSNAMNRLSILERRTDQFAWESADNATNVVDQIQKTIDHIKYLFPEIMYTIMPEYINLWSSLYSNAEVARDWNTAYNTCIDNPVTEQKNNQIQRLVKAMVDAGALGELIDMCNCVTSSSKSEAIDFAEVAAKVLSSDNLVDRLSADESPDYLGCLYTLHVHRLEWKRAAEVMDVRFGQSLTSLTDSLHPRLVADISLSAIACSMALAQIPDKANRFIISGEMGPFPSIPMVDNREASPKSILKRGRDGTLGSNNNSSNRSAEKEDEDRLERFMLLSDTRARATRALAFRSLALDKESIPFQPSLLSNKAALETDVTIIEALATGGFFSLAHQISECIRQSKESQFQGALIKGRDIVFLALSDIINMHLVPLILPNHDADFKDNSYAKRKRSLPSLKKLVRAIEATDRSSYAICCIGGPSKPATIPSRLSSAAMELVRKLVMSCSSASCPLAMETAEAFLDLGAPSLPAWLEDCLMGVNMNNPDGIFGSKASPSSSTTVAVGDPSALCSLYMKKGMLVEACGVVSRVLTGPLGGQFRRAQAAFRLPERGNIDYVPHAKIDLLWNLIEHVLRESDLNEKVKSDLRVARLGVENALTFHFSLVKISEDGQASARAL